MHTPVLQKEVLQELDPKANENFIDCTFGEGGHASAILEKNGSEGKVLGIDLSLKPEVKSSKRLILTRDNFANLKEIVKKYKLKPVNGILFDLGLSSWNLEESGRGFTFQKREPLDMRYGLENQLTAEKIVNYWSRFDIERILKEYGEEKFAQEIAEKIIEERKARIIKTTSQLVEIIEKAVPKSSLRQRIHFATRTFQALRITVNDELNNLNKALPQALDILQSSGKLVVISFHSLEDRIVKNFFKKEKEKGMLDILTKKPVLPNQKEIKINPRSRSAKLRACQKR